MNTSKPYVLMTNDDGVHSLGIKSLHQALNAHADITVVAPHVDQSAVSLAITIRNPLRIEKAFWEKADYDIWCVNGTPIDCVKLGLNTVMRRKPDLVISGINRGSNSGRNVLYSGTVGAAIEGAMQNIPAIAFSSEDYKEPDYARVQKYIPAIIDFVLAHPLPQGTLLNVSFPEKHLNIKGFKMTAQGSEIWAENLDKRFHESEENYYYWLGSKLRPPKETEDGDGKWLRQGYITAVPIHILNLTDFKHLEAVRTYFERFFKE